MSPEQAEGRPLDARSDIFSFGAVLYEMLSGTRAFAGHTVAQVLSAVLRDDPAPLPQAPSAVDRMVRRCLSKHPGDRFQTMQEVKACSRRGVDETWRPAAVDRRSSVCQHERRQGARVLQRWPGRRDHQCADTHSRPQSHGADVFIRVSWRRTRHHENRGSPWRDHVLEGSVRRAGNRIRVTAQLINAQDGYHLWSERFDRELADVFAIQDEIAQAIAGSLQLKLVGTSADRPHTPKLPAYDAVLRGRHHLFKLSPETWTRAKECFEHAIALDPAYADAHAYLSLGYFFMGMNGILPLRDVAHLVREEAQKALDLKPSEIGPRFLLGGIAAAYDYDWKVAAEHFDAALAANPVVPNARWAYASFCSNPFGRFQDSAANMQLEVEQDPLNILWRCIWANHLQHAGMYSEGIAETQKALDLDENFWLAHYNLAEIYIATGQFAEAVAAGEKAYRSAPWNSMATGVLAAALVRVGERDRAQALIEQMGDRPIPLWGRVGYHLLCSEIDAAADWYEKAIQERDPFAVVFACIPYGKGLRESPRWPKLAKMMNLPERIASI